MPSPSDLFRVIVTESIGSDGLILITTVGQLEQIGGQEFVRCGRVLHGTDGWHATKEAAMADAADVVEARAARIAAQAERMRMDQRPAVAAAAFLPAASAGDATVPANRASVGR